MLKPCYFFSNDVKRSVKIGLLALFAILTSGAADPNPQPTPAALPELTLHEVGAGDPTHEFQVGDRITLQAELKEAALDAGQTLELKPADPNLKLEDAGWYLDPSTLNQSGVFRFIASPLKGGALTLPSLLISKTGSPPLAKTIAINLKIKETKGQPNEKPDLLDVVNVPLPPLYWVILLAGSALLFALIFWLIRRYLKNRAKPKPRDIPIIPVIPDHEIALRKLDDLFSGLPFNPENLKIFSFGVSEILKEFFSRRFQIDALESTSDEMIRLLRKESLSPDQIREIQNLFLELDQFKFIKVESYPSVSEETSENIKIQSRLIVQKWAFISKGTGETP